MKILIGSPIHSSQDVLIKPWIENMAQMKYPADILFIDSSPEDSYIHKVKGYCKKFGLTRYKFKHFDHIHSNGEDERLGRSRELIRKYILKHDYDAWLCWESNIHMPVNGIYILSQIMQSGNYALVSHNPSARVISRHSMRQFGCDLIKRDPLTRYGFHIDYPDMPNCWYRLGVWFKQRLLRDGSKYVELNLANQKHIDVFKNDSALKLNLGCGTKHLDNYINIDIQAPCDLLHDLRNPLPFMDGVVDEIFSQGNVICLFSRAEWSNLKYEMHRVLKPGGKLHINFLDFEYLLKQFLKHKDHQRDWWIETIFSGQHNEYEFSKNGFTYEYLAQELIGVGMVNPRREQGSEPFQANIICYKDTTTHHSHLPFKG